MWKYLKDYKKETVLGPLFKLLEAGFELAVPLVVAAIIDQGIGGEDKGLILKYCGILVALGLIGLGCSVTAQYFAARASVGFVKKLRSALWAHIQRFTYAQLDRTGIPTLVTRMTSDMNQVQTGLNLTLRLLLRSPFVVFGAMVMAFTIDGEAAVWFAVAIPALSLVVFGIMLASIPLYRKVQSGLDKVLGLTRENLTGVRVLRAFGKEEDETRAFDGRNEALTGLQKYVGRISALMNPVTYVIINLAIVMLVRTGAMRVEAGAITQGAVVALYNYMSQILVELIKMANLIINITKSVACGKRIQAVLDLPAGEEVIEGLEAGDPKWQVEFRHAGIRYSEGADESLTDVCLQVAPGETVGVIGGTGSGKSTLVSLIPRFYDVTEGQVLVGGRDVRSWEGAELRRRIGIVPQKAVLFKGSIRENLMWGREDATDAEMLAAAEAAQALDVIDAKGGLDGAIEQGGRNLSGGQRQRLTIARALVRRPDILIMDDSSSALDFATDAALRKALKGYPGTVFIVSQRTSSIRHAEKIVVLDDGKVAGIGRHEELMASCPVYREIHDSQFRKEGA